MISKASTVDEYLDQVSDYQKEAFYQLRKTILDNLPKGLSEEISYGMIGYIVPFSIYPAGYHCDPKLPLPFISIAAQKNNLSFYHMGMYADPLLREWFCSEFPKYSDQKLDMGKGCTRFKNGKPIPYKLIGELVGKMEVPDWIWLYETGIKNKQKT